MANIGMVVFLCMLLPAAVVIPEMVPPCLKHIVGLYASHAMSCLSVRVIVISHSR